MKVAKNCTEISNSSNSCPIHDVFVSRSMRHTTKHEIFALPHFVIFTIYLTVSKYFFFRNVNVSIFQCTIFISKQTDPLKKTIEIISLLNNRPYRTTATTKPHRFNLVRFFVYRFSWIQHWVCWKNCVVLFEDDLDAYFWKIIWQTYIISPYIFHVHDCVNCELVFKFVYLDECKS